jgi:hypothetical protein
MEDREKKKRDQKGTAETREKERLSRREAMKRVAKGVALVGTLGVTAVVTQGQDECTGGYVNLYSNLYYNYSNAYYNYSNAYYNYYDAYYNYSNAYYNYYDTYYNYYDNYGYYNW